jgi:hypothetical protein
MKWLFESAFLLVFLSLSIPAHATTVNLNLLSGNLLQVQSIADLDINGTSYQATIQDQVSFSNIDIDDLVQFVLFSVAEDEADDLRDILNSLDTDPTDVLYTKTIRVPYALVDPSCGDTCGVYALSLLASSTAPFTWTVNDVPVIILRTDVGAPGDDFVTFTRSVAAPEPASLILLALGLAGIIVLRIYGMRLARNN